MIKVTLRSLFITIKNQLSLDLSKILSKNINFKRFTPAWKAIGHIFYENSEPVNAKKYYEKALSIDTNDVEVKHKFEYL